MLLGEAGFEPLGFIVGSSIYHLGLQIGRWNRNTEFQVLTPDGRAFTSDLSAQDLCPLASSA